MAAANGKKGYRIRFELSIAGLLVLVVVCFCIFLWMFLLGLWAGQSGVISGISLSSLPAIPTAARVETAKLKPPPETAPEPEPVQTPPAPETQAPAAPAEPAPAAAPPEPPPPPEAAEEPETTAPATPGYAIQVGAFRDNRHVEEAMRKWRDRGYEVFSHPPTGPNEHLTKVYLGRFPDAATARAEAAELAKKTKISPIIVAIPAEGVKRP